MCHDININIPIQGKGTCKCKRFVHYQCRLHLLLIFAGIFLLRRGG